MHQLCQSDTVFSHVMMIHVQFKFHEILFTGNIVTDQFVLILH